MTYRPMKSMDNTVWRLFAESTNDWVDHEVLAHRRGMTLTQTVVP